MATIRITADELYDILTMKSEKEEEVRLWQHLEENGFIFNEFMLTIRGDYFGKYLDIVYKVKIDGVNEKQKIKIKEIMIDKEGKRKITETETTVGGFLDELHEVLKITIEATENNKREELKAVENDTMLCPMFFMKYCIDKAMNREIIECKTTKKKYKPINERSKTKPKTEYKLFEIIRKYERHINHNRHNMTCEHWEVKGHFRHYKNGKVVYIKPFSKGKNKEAKIENKTYKL